MVRLRQFVSGMRWYEVSEYLLILLTAIAVPIYWRIGLWCFILLSANTIVKIFATRHIGNPTIPRPAKTCLFLMMLYFIIYAVSISYSNNPTEAFSTIQTMLPMLICPIIFLSSDMSYIKTKHLRLITFLLAATLTIRFFFVLPRHGILSLSDNFTRQFYIFVLSCIARGSHLLFNDTIFEPVVDGLTTSALYASSHSFPKNHNLLLDPLHHNYLSLYILTAIALLYTDLTHHWKLSNYHRTRWFVIADIILLSVYIILIKSRSGLVALSILSVICLLHLGWWKKKKKIAYIVIACTIAVAGATYLVAPKMYKHVTSTAKNLVREGEGDVRQKLWRCGLYTFKERPILGYGCDGYWIALNENYHKYDCPSGFQGKLSTHNQYLETAMSVGLIGLVVMLCMMVAPAILSFRRPRRNLSMLLFTIVYAICIFFEATFERQMGLLFIPWWYCLLLVRPLPPPASETVAMNNPI